MKKKKKKERKKKERMFSKFKRAQQHTGNTDIINIIIRQNNIGYRNAL